MNFNLFDGMDGIVLREREGSMMKQDMNDAVLSDMNLDKSRFPSKTPLGMAYVPFQQWGDMFPEDEGFEKGTIFPELDFPFMNGGEADE